jgi:hypothetical protein
MATLCEAGRQKLQVAHMLRLGMGNGLIDISSAIALLEADSDCCGPDSNEGNE